jgi:hypothetical protein
MKNKELLALAVSIFLINTGCSSTGSGTFVKNNSANAVSGCNYQIITDLPAGNYIEVGVVKDLHAGILPVSSLSQVKEAVEPYVCAYGGDAVVPIKKSGSIYFSEMYTEAIIIRQK